MKSSAARKSSISPGPSLNAPALRPAPRKLNRSDRAADSRERLRRLVHRPSCASSRRTAGADGRRRRPRAARRRRRGSSSRASSRPAGPAISRSMIGILGSSRSRPRRGRGRRSRRNRAPATRTRPGFVTQPSGPSARASRGCAPRMSGRYSVEPPCSGTTWSSPGSPVTTSVGAVTRAASAARSVALDGARAVGHARERDRRAEHGSELRDRRSASRSRGEGSAAAHLGAQPARRLEQEQRPEQPAAAARTRSCRPLRCQSGPGVDASTSAADAFRMAWPRSCSATTPPNEMPQIDRALDRPRRSSSRMTSATSSSTAARGIEPPADSALAASDVASTRNDRRQRLPVGATYSQRPWMPGRRTSGSWSIVHLVARQFLSVLPVFNVY